MFIRKQIKIITIIIQSKLLLPQPPNKLPKQSKLKLLPPQLPPKKSNKKIAIITIHKQLFCKNLKSSIILPPIINVNDNEFLIYSYDASINKIT